MPEQEKVKTISKEQVRTFLKQAQIVKDAFLVASLTDEYIVDYWPDIKGYTEQGEKNTLTGKEDKILEIRIFNPEQERKLFRGDIGKEFHERVILEQEITNEFYDESQILDIDEKRSEQCFKNANRVITTGGGSYYLPLPKMKDARVRIRYYLSKYEETGQARICDWRLLEFKNGEKKEG